jgi:hypothetical protein
MANIFDQFDQKKKVNIFDQFDPEPIGYAGGSGREQYHDAGMDADISDMSKRSKS